MPEQFLAPDGCFFVAYAGGEPVGCAGFRRHDGTTAELKRMYVRPAARGTGVARALLAEVERAVSAAGYAQLWLETGVAQPEAMTLYASAGYTPIASFGQFADAPDSRCFGKLLGSDERESRPRRRAPLS